MGYRQVVRLQTLTLASLVRIQLSQPFLYDPLAQSVEHMTFNHGVRGSIPRWVTICGCSSTVELQPSKLVVGVRFPPPAPNHFNPRGVAQLGARVLWEHEVAGSIPVTPTILLCGSGSVVERHLAKVNVASSNLVFRSTCGCSSMVEFQPSKLVVRVRFPSPAPLKPA